MKNPRTSLTMLLKGVSTRSQIQISVNKIKAMLTKEYNNGKNKKKRSLKEIEHEIDLFNSDRGSKDTMKFFGKIFCELIMVVVVVTVVYSVFLAKEDEMERIKNLVTIW
uniref:Uncharacterized protein n=1 Tax=Euplotes crassus TaxID=5936 RepID=A0A7S3K6R6_EUPCR|mmetsp:Transcript_10116/g.9973  ORF Transcript_10116/g.9973 Transcript_10116/m.9973 type:complete len:109 (+) Transcript_10116:194-520(+)